MQGMIANFEVSDFTVLEMLIDGPSAAVRWQATFHYTKTGRTAIRPRTPVPSPPGSRPLILPAAAVGQANGLSSILRLALPDLAGQ